jgi:hypothetical protein
MPIETAEIYLAPPGGKGATTGGNAEAWSDSVRQVEAFFAAHLKPNG